VVGNEGISLRHITIKPSATTALPHTVLLPTACKGNGLSGWVAALLQPCEISEWSRTC
jgi:hypothetical protein